MHYCSVCDGVPYKEKDIVVVGDGNSAFDEGLYLHRLGVRRITLVKKENRFFAAKKAQDALLGNANVTCRLNTFVEDLTGWPDFPFPPFSMRYRLFWLPSAGQWDLSKTVGQLKHATEFDRNRLLHPLSRE